MAKIHIKLIKIVFEMNEYKTFGYKVKSFDKCCDEILENPLFSFFDQDVCNDAMPKPALRYTETINSWGDEFTQDEFYDIKHCPFCGESVSVELVGEEDFSDLYGEIEKLRNEVNKKFLRVDSKKKSIRYGIVRNQLDKILNYFYKVDYYKTKEEIKEWFEFAKTGLQKEK